MPVPVQLGRRTKLDRYDLLYEVGRGGMGTVWAAVLRGKHGFEKLVAVKTILPEFAAEPRFRSLLLNEARITAKIEHPNVVQTFELGEHRGALYVVMEWIDGESLHVLRRELERTGNPVVPMAISLRLIADVCAGLHAAHDMRDENGNLATIIHNDISPHNILVTARGIAKLADFGVAKIHNRVAVSQANETSSVRGKLRYIAPERLSGREDRRSDIWSLGVVLQELLPLSAPAACRRIVERALAPEPERRFATAFELGQAIESVMDECYLTATLPDVASFFSPILRERSEVRKRKIDSTQVMGATLDVAHHMPRPRVPSEETVPLSKTLPVRTLVAMLPEVPPENASLTAPVVRGDASKSKWWLLAFLLGTAAALIAGFALLRPWQAKPSPDAAQEDSPLASPLASPPSASAAAPAASNAPRSVVSSAPPGAKSLAPTPVDSKPHERATPERTSRPKNVPPPKRDPYDGRF